MEHVYPQPKGKTLMRYDISKILAKINARSSMTDIHLYKDIDKVTLPSIMGCSFAEVKKRFSEELTWGELKFLHEHAQNELNDNKMAESRILTRANPQLTNAVRLGIQQSSKLRSYNQWFGGRSGQYVKPGNVSSMFSPAGYLTELYREARKLHNKESPFHLDSRRPDLKSLSLSQSSMDDELSTLSLSNELLMNNIQKKAGKDFNGVLGLLAAYNHKGATPFDMRFQTVRQSIALQDEYASAMRRSPDVENKLSPFILSGIQSDISPALHAVLTEEITDEKADGLVSQYFGIAHDSSALKDIGFLSNLFDIDVDELKYLLDAINDGNHRGWPQEYHQDKFTSVNIKDNNQLDVTIIQRKHPSHQSEMQYIELIPKGNDDYDCSFAFSVDKISKPKSIHLVSGTDSNPPSFFESDIEDMEIGPGGRITVPINIPDLTVNEERIEAQLYLSDGHRISVAATFSHADVNYSAFILNIYKVIILHKASRLSLLNVLAVIHSFDNNFIIDENVLKSLALRKEYQQRYNIDVAAASVLAGGPINQRSDNKQPSAFTQLFNSPFINNQVFSADGSTLTLTPDNASSTYTSAVLKRAFQVNDSELYSLWSLATGKNTPPDFICNINNLSALYRVSLLARVHHLSIAELAALFSLSPYSNFDFTYHDAEELPDIVNFLDLHTQWLKDQGWTVSMLYLMAFNHVVDNAQNLSVQLTPEISNLLTTLKEGLPAVEDDVDDDTLLHSAAPLIAAVTGLDSAETALAMLQWINTLCPFEISVYDFLYEVRMGEESSRIINYCQVLGQLVLIIRMSSLTSRELERVVNQPKLLSPTLETLPRTVETIRNMTRFHRWLQQCGDAASELLSSLADGNLSPAQVAQAMGLDVQTVTQALAQSDNNALIFNSWSDIDATLQWLDVANCLHVTPQTAGLLASLTYVEDPSRWETISDALLAGLNKQQTAQLNAALDEALSSALCAWLINDFSSASSTDKPKPPALQGIRSRDDIYSYLLIDNKVSAQVKTTRLAEAIASIQLYVNRTLNAQEPGVDYSVRTRQFFTDWDSYNKRYSTWAGVSQLVYYPENYVDPTMRLGQTSMMDEMLQSLSQSQLTGDSVEAAFKTYMTRFEEIANLDVISGYHDSLSDKQGTTYLIGRSDINEYYWRSADIGKITAGKLPANAWSEWYKITAAISAVNNLVRPVIFQSRLYLVWVENKEVFLTEGDKTKKIIELSLKYAHILHDGTWSAPRTVKLNDDFVDTFEINENNVGLYCASDVDEPLLHIYFYQKEGKYNGAPKDISGINIDPSNAFNEVDDDDIGKNINYIYKQLDTTNTVMLNSAFVHGNIEFVISTPKSVYSEMGTSGYSSLTAGLLGKPYVKEVNKKLVIGFNSSADISYAYRGDDADYLRAALTITSKLDDVVYIPFWNDHGYSNKTGCVVNLSQKKMFATVPVYIRDYVEITLIVDGRKFVYTSKDFADISAATNYVSVEYTSDIAPGRVIIKDTRTNTRLFDSMSFLPLDTKIEEKNVSLSVSGGTSVQAESKGEYSFYNARFSFGEQEITLPSTNFNNNEMIISFVFSASVPGWRKFTLGKESLEATIFKKSDSSLPLITLNRTDADAQYLQYQNSCIRVNTLFAKQLVARANDGLNNVLSWDTQQLPEPPLGDDSTETMDFSGANGLYFWEMFYYVPMMVFRRLQQEGRFAEATQWIKYIWSPEGYFVHGQPAPYQWNVRPLQDETSWHDSPLDSVDPDAVAQADPMHYKVATFMGMLDLLIARGDAAYRQLERDTLNEAKMWYMQALNILGEEPDLVEDTRWANPSLGDAADKTANEATQQALMSVRQPTDAPTLYTANSLTNLFLPQQNEKLRGYWQTLAQRLYNLRHNLSIDGQPLSLAIYSKPADPAALLSAAVSASQGGTDLPPAVMPVYRFPMMLESARGMVGQLSQFGSTLLSLTERQDAEALSEMLQTQGAALMEQSIAAQQKNIDEIDADTRALQATRDGAQARLDSYTALYEENINPGEKHAMNLSLAASTLSSTSTVAFTVGAALDAVPNIYGMAVGGSQYGAVSRAVGFGIEVAASATRAAAERIGQSEAWRRRSQEWEIQRNMAASDVRQIDAQLATLKIRREAAGLQTTYLETQQAQTQAQLTFLRNKFSNKALYSWLRGKLASIYYQFYDLTASRCLMAQEAYKWSLSDEAASFIRPGAWKSTYAGLMAGETLMLNLAQMEHKYMEKQQRDKEVTRTVSLAEVYAGLPDGSKFDLAKTLEKFVNEGKGSTNDKLNKLSIIEGNVQASVQLAGLNITKDYPVSLGTTRRIKQISVTLPALVGPYQDVRAVLNYGGSRQMPQGCNALAVSHGMNDSGQFQLDFNDGRWLPFEGIAVDDPGTFTLSFPDALTRQKTMLLSLTDIILHIRYTISH